MKKQPVYISLKIPSVIKPINNEPSFNLFKYQKFWFTHKFMSISCNQRLAYSILYESVSDRGGGLSKHFMFRPFQQLFGCLSYS